MKKLLRIILISLILLASYSRTTVPTGVSEDIHNLKTIQILNILEFERYNKVLNNYLDLLGYDESRNQWWITNEIGAIGEFQFMIPTLKILGYEHITLNKFKKDPTIFLPHTQREAVLALMEHHSREMFDYIVNYEGKYINNILITRAGILAACHLGGPKNVKLYLDSNGHINKQDINGTSIATYLHKYQIFNLYRCIYKEV